MPPEDFWLIIQALRLAVTGSSPAKQAKGASYGIPHMLRHREKKGFTAEGRPN